MPRPGHAAALADDRLAQPERLDRPKEVDDHKVEGFWRAHQVPLAEVREKPAHLKQLEEWLRSYKPEKLFDEAGRLQPDLRELAPKGARRMGANPHANGGLLRKSLRYPTFATTLSRRRTRARIEVGPTQLLGQFLRDIARDNPHNFRVFSPDENASNRLTALYEVTKKTWLGEYFPEDADGSELAPDGRVMEMLSEHTLEGWLEGYLADRKARLFLDLRSVCARHRLDVQPALPNGWRNPGRFPGAQTSPRSTC